MNFPLRKIKHRIIKHNHFHYWLITFCITISIVGFFNYNDVWNIIPAEGMLYWPGTNLSESNASFIGENEGDILGNTLADVGDVNADGYDDFLIGARQNSEGGSWAGQVYLILGNSTENFQMDLNVSIYATASFIGENPVDTAGSSLAGVGDVNADGYDDFLIGAENNDEGGPNTGQSYLILGRETDTWKMDQNLGLVANASFIGEAENDELGESLAGVGDANNDSYDDFIIGAPDNDEGGSDAGQSYLILGRKTDAWQMDQNIGTHANASFIGEAEDDWLGYSLTGVGDTNNDSYDDFLIGAEYNDEGGENTGQTYLILGSKIEDWQMDQNIGTYANASFIGEAKYDRSGSAVAGIGDVDADGYDDFLIGAVNADEQIYLILGQNTSSWTLDQSLSMADASYSRESGGDYTGRAVAGAGDVNGDGYDDYLIGAPNNNEGGSVAGQCYLIFGNKFKPHVYIISPVVDTYYTNTILIEYIVSRITISTTIYFDNVANTTNMGSGTVLTNLIDGEHNFTIVVTSADNLQEKKTILFSIDTTAPVINIISPTEKVYKSKSITFTYTISEKPYITIIYLDGIQNTSNMESGTTLEDLAEGEHNITVLAADKVFNVDIETVIFTVNTISSETDSISSITGSSDDTPGFNIFLSGLGIIFVSLIFFKRRKR